MFHYFARKLNTYLSWNFWEHISDSEEIHGKCFGVMLINFPLIKIKLEKTKQYRMQIVWYWFNMFIYYSPPHFLQVKYPPSPPFFSFSASDRGWNLQYYWQSSWAVCSPCKVDRHVWKNWLYSSWSEECPGAQYEKLDNV